MRAENDKPSLKLAHDTELYPKPGFVAPEVKLTFSYLGRLHLRNELDVLLHEPLHAANWSDNRTVPLAETMAFAGEDLQPIYDQIEFRRQQAIKDNRNQYVRDKIETTSLKVQTIDGNTPSLREVLGQVVEAPQQLEPLLYIAEWLDEHGDGDAAPFVDAAVGILSELSKRTSKGLLMFPSDVSKGYSRAGVLTRKLIGGADQVFDMAEDWLDCFEFSKDPFWYYQNVAKGVIECGLTDKALSLAARLRIPGNIKARDTRNGIYEDVALRLASEGRFDEALAVGDLYTRGGRYPLMITIHGDRAIYKASKGNDPTADIEVIGKILEPNYHQRPPTLVKGHLRIGLARLKLGDYKAAEASLQQAWFLALHEAKYSQEDVALSLDDAGYDAAPLFIRALQQDQIPETAIDSYRMKIMQELAKRGYIDVASQFLGSAKPSFAVSVSDISDLAKVELQQAPSASELKGIDRAKGIEILKERYPLLDMAMVDLGLLQDVDEPSRQLWANGIFPSKSILKHLEEGTSIAYLIRVNQDIEAGRFNPNDPLHRDLQYRQYLEACRDGTITPSPNDFMNLGYRDETDNYQLSYEEEREADAAAYEAARFYWVVADRVNCRRNIVVLGNNRYGELFVVRPLEHNLQRWYIGDTGVKIRYGRVPSSTSAKNSVPNIFNNQAKLAGFIEDLREDNTDLFIVDGSSTQFSGKPRLPKSMVGYLNWIAAFNEATGKLTMDISDSHLEELRRSVEFQKMVDFIRLQQPSHGFRISHWTPQIAKTISFGSIFDQEYREPERADSETIFVNPVTNMSEARDVPVFLQGHKQGYFDDPDKNIGKEKEVVFTKTGIRLVPAKAPLEEVLIHAVQDRMELVMDQMIRLTNPI